ncbi:unnamed protein product [Medioppia subpectinata]|uniref:alpha-glucosidase n=1 Tax=Medioppia subpectinata TaxID=1979941 RepID=A0A7R9PTV5_9ACAR|nr:unnamed protein product [Medioppia subpectinata]CAG2100956.1 unnamed protein product [Medioppia subpectinata]
MILNVTPKIGGRFRYRVTALQITQPSNYTIAAAIRAAPVTAAPVTPTLVYNRFLRALCGTVAPIRAASVSAAAVSDGLVIAPFITIAPISIAPFSLVLDLPIVSNLYTKSNDLNKRLDCYLENDFEFSKTECEKRGCNWDNDPELIDSPQCYINTDKIGYNLFGKKVESEKGFEIDLQLKDTAKSLLKSMQQIDKLRLKVDYLTENILRFKIFDPKVKRYEFPLQNTFPFDTSIGGLIFSDQLLHISTYLPTKHIYGFGENTHHSLKHNINYKTWNLFSRGEGPDDGVINLYGVHPFYTGLESDGKSHGILFLNSNAMEYTLMPEPALSLKTLGGVLDFFVFVGENPEEVIQLYTSLIGRQFLPPFWSLGFQITRYGFKNTEQVKNTLERNIVAKVPLDVTYLDIDYMNRFQDFTYDKENFKGLPQLISWLKNDHNIHTTLMLSPAILGNDSTYNAFSDGYDNDVYIKWPKYVNTSEQHNPPDVRTDKSVLYGKVWPDGPVAFPDFFKPATHKWWTKWIQYTYKDLDLKFDSIWIDMNEPYDFAFDGTSRDYCPRNKLDNPPARIQSIYAYENYTKLSDGTICMCSIQGENGEYSHSDVHSLYGLTESIATQKTVREITGKRGYVLSRSTYVSSGRYTAHWLGDNIAEWSQMRDSIIGVLEFNLFGISFVGADICGFFHETTPELCRRWLQMGAFYPFSRNHNEIHPSDQDPAVWVEKGHPEVTKAAINALNLRYTLLPYLYTLFYRSHTMGQTVARPLVHEFPTDTNTYEIQEQFMWGRSVLISPFLYEKQTEVSAYLPNDIWYEILPQIVKVKQTGKITIKEKSPTDPPPVHLRGGSIIPMSVSSVHINTNTVRQSAINLVVLPDVKSEGLGDLYWDDGESIDTIENGNYNYYSFELLSNSSLVLKAKHNNYTNAPKVEEIRVYGTKGTEVLATLDGQPVSALIDRDDGSTRIRIQLNLNTKKSGDQWVVNWTHN